METESGAAIDLGQFREFIDDVDREVKNPELTEVLREISALIERIQLRIDAVENRRDLGPLQDLRRDRTVTHGVTLEWKNVNMGIRTLVLKMRNYVTTLFGAITRLDDYQELQIGLSPRPHFLVGRFRSGFSAANLIYAWETTVDSPTETITRKKGQSVRSDNVIFNILSLRVFGKINDMEYMTAEGNTPLDLIKNFCNSLRKAVEQLGA